MMWVVYIVAAVVLVVVLTLLAYLVELISRPITNEKGLQEALKFRESQLPHTRRAHDDCIRDDYHADSVLFPMRTNLCREDVGGAGMLLHFNFQAVVIGWAMLVALGWICLAYAVDTDLLILGTRKFGTPRDNCVMVAWGYETQQRLLWTKEAFLWCVYLGSFLLCLLHGVRQLRLFQNVDQEEKTMKDFAAFCTGLPELVGDRPLEEELQQCIADATGAQVIGVSIAWNTKARMDEVDEALQKGMVRQEKLYRETL